MQMAMGEFFNLYLIYFLILFLFINILFQIKLNLQIFHKIWPFWLSIAIFIIWVILDLSELESSKIVIGDAFNILFWVAFILVLNSIIKNNSDYRRFEYLCHLLTFLAVSIASLIGGYKFNQILQGNFASNYYAVDGTLINGTSLSQDYNIFASALILGAISGKYLIDKTRNKFVRFLIIAFDLYILVIVFFSSSRRGVLFIFLTLFILLTFSFNQTGYFHQFRRNLLKNIFGVGIPLVLILLLFSRQTDRVFSNDKTVQILNRISTLNNEETVANDRIVRLNYANDLVKSFSWPELIYGNGFLYLNKYSNHFHTQEGSDYPHNFFYSTLLYSGIVGLCLMIFLIIYVSKAYILNFSFVGSFAIWFLILLLFSVTSTNTWYSLRLNIFLTLLPFLTLINSNKRVVH